MQVAVCGGRGFVGQVLCTRLAGKGHQVSVLSRETLDYGDDAAVLAALQDKDALVYLGGILHERGGQRFDDVHHHLPVRLLQLAAQSAIGDFLHMSALGVSAHAPSRYLQSKWAGERALMAQGKALGVRVVAMRPSVIFAGHDGFFHLFAHYLRYAPLMPLPCAQAQFQPVAVEDVADAFVWALESSVDQTAFELGGTERLTLHEAVQRICKANGWKRWIIPLSDRLSRWQGRLGGMLRAPFDHDNYLSMQVPNITEEMPWTQMGIVPRAIHIPRLNGRD